MESTLLIIIIVLLVIAILLIVFFRNKGGSNQVSLQSKLEELQGTWTKIESNFKEDFRINREENTTVSKDNRIELNNTLKDFKAGLTESSDKLKAEVASVLKDFGERQRENFSDLLKNLTIQAGNSSEKLELIRDTVEKKITELQKGNEVKLDEMRKTVDEKLNDTLEKRLGESFKLVSERLEAVHRGLGDMQGLAKDVGNLNKTMNNVKSRGVLGEYQCKVYWKTF